MVKKIYIAPGIKVRKIESDELLAGSGGTISTGISDTPATGGGRAKGSIFSIEEDDDASSNKSNIWGD